MNIQIRGWNQNIPLQRINDKSIMVAFAQKGYTIEKLKTLNKCRKYLEIMTLSDIVTASGLQISSDAIEGKRNKYRTSSYKWQNNHRPYLQSWSIWEESIRETFCANNDSNLLREPLLDFHFVPENWKWYYSASNDCMLYKDGNVYRRYKRYKKHQYTRLSYSWYKLSDVVSSDSALITHLASISSMVDGSNMIALEGTYILPRSSPDAYSSPIDLFQILQISHTPTWMYQHQEESLRQLTKPFLEEFFKDKAVVVSDGSYKDEKGAAAVILENSILDQRIILTVPVPANETLLENDSYRSEAVGVLYGLHVIQSIESVLNVQDMHVLVGCDSDSVIDVAQYHDYVTQNSRHRDVVVSLIEVRKSIKATLSFKKIKGHADKLKPFPLLSRLEQLNVYCDKLAKCARVTLAPVHISTSPFFGEGI